MSKYVQFRLVVVRMKTFIYLIIIIFNFTQTVICNQYYNESGEDSLQECSNVRRKREYTRWRAQAEKPTEFVVKVFDDDYDVLPTPTIMTLPPVFPTRTPLKIIVKPISALIPTRTSESTFDSAVEYTRFKPPAEKKRKAISTDALKPLPFPNQPSRDYGVIKPPKRQEAVLGPGRHPQRDESPPVQPQFLPRTPPRTIVTTSGVTPSALLTPPQPPFEYPPVAPVGFAKPRLSSSFPHINPLVIFKHLPEKRAQTKHDDAVLPTRSTQSVVDELYDHRPFHLDEITSNDIVITRTTVITVERPERTTKNVLKVLLGDVIGNFLSRTSNQLGLFRDKPVSESPSKKDDTAELLTEAYPEYDLNSRRKGEESSSAETTTTTTSSTFEMKDIKENEVEGRTEVTQSINNESDREDYQQKEYNQNDVIGSSVENTGGNDTKKIEFNQRPLNPVCNLEEINKFNFTSIATLNEINLKLKTWAAYSPVTEIVDITQGNLTTMENPIYMLTVDDPRGGQIPASKQTVMIVAGIQGRDHFAVAAAMYVLYQLIERSEVHADLLDKYRFWIIPVFNPDGYEYSKRFPHRREWKKNLRQNWDTCKDSVNSAEICEPCQEYGIRCYLQPCFGVNLDRNFEYQWIPGHELRAEHPCGELYAGKRQLSEVETFSLTNYLRDQKTPLFAFIAYKEGDVLGVLYPHSHTRKQRPYDHVYRSRATVAAAAAFGINGRPYVSGQTSEFLPLYAGGIEDWSDGHLGVDNSYAIIMNRPGDTKFPVSIERVAHEAYAAMDTLLLQKGTLSQMTKTNKGFMVPRRRSGPAATVAQTKLKVLFTILCIIWFS